MLQKKSYDFALEAIIVYKGLLKDHREYILSRQMLRSCTSIGANIEEALGAQSRKEFRSKISISYKEARESKYWLRLLKDSGFLSEIISVNMIDKNEEMLRILGSIQKTLQKE